MQLTPTARRVLPHAPSAAGLASVALGVFVLACWAMGHVLWVKLGAHLAPVQPDAAACFIILGAALYGARDHRWLAAVLASVAMVFAGVVFFSYLLGIKGAWGWVLLPRSTGPETFVAGRMAPNTAFAFIGSGASIVAAFRRRLLAALLASVVFSVGAVALAGYLFGIPAAFAWGRYTHMSLLTSVGLTILGAGVMARAFDEQRLASRSRRGWAPLLVGLTAALFGVFFSAALRVQENDQIARTLTATTQGVGAEIESRFDATISSMRGLVDLAARGVANGEPLSDLAASAAWTADARLATAGLRGFDRLELLREDAGLQPRILAASHPEPLDLVRNRDEDTRLEAAVRFVHSAGEPTVAGPFHFTDGENAFRVILPFGGTRDSDAYLSAVFSARDTFAGLSAHFAPMYATVIACDDEVVFSQTPDDTSGSEWSRELPLTVRGPARWSVRITPAESALRAQRSTFPILALTASFLIAALLTLTLRFEGLAAERAERFEVAVRERTEELESTTKRLQWENAERRRTADTLRRMQAVSRYVSGELDLSKVVQAVIDAATALTGADAGAFFYNTGRHDEVMRYAVSGVAAAAFAELPFPRRTELLRQTFEGVTVVRLDNVRNDPRFGKMPPYSGLPPSYPIDVSSYLAVPVLSRAGEIWGGIFLGHAKAGVFSEREEEIAVGLAAQASIAMDNARLYEAERAAHAEAQTANLAKDRFLAILGHELRNPLGSIRNAFEVMALRPDDRELRARMHSIADRQLLHLSRLVDELLDISRIERGKVTLQRENVDLAALVREQLDSHATSASASGVKLVADLPSEPVWADGDPTRLAQILSNLVSNAFKFTDSGGEVRVRLRAEEGEAVLSVCDTGAGVAPDNIEFIFEPFAQTDESLDRSIGGLGLGLPIVKGLVEAHGGTVRASSPGLGRGTELTVRLPCVRPPEPLPRRAVLETPRPRLRILVIDDHVDSAEGLSELLTLYGHGVELAHTGAEGIRAARSACPDVVICDIGLPEIDGYQVARTLRGDARTAQARLIALTGYGDENSARRARDAGFDLHLTKPLDAGALRRVLASLTERPAPVVH